ncbi:CMGC protein kinase [Microthyrium microscopicum]|uniref:non-specific serine/threonine protein kinase n=1 Tax=Microthyrium microscopicum TaxID=703497 RepID=A0A6A6UJ11_9PEZI|nr:CMGC protein kinase [Microthyrium microscopicum]
MQTLFKYARSLVQKRPLTPLQFPATGFQLINDHEIIEEEQFEEFKAGRYYPVNIGDIFHTRYQVVGKLGFGLTSTVWLARDLVGHDFKTLKIYTRGGVDQEEFNIYQIINKTNRFHPGYSHVRTALDVFTIPRLGGDHKCLVQKPMWDSFKDLLNRNPTHRFTEDLLRVGLTQIFLGLSYLHSECKIVHTDIKADNILVEIADKSLLDSFTQAELDHPSPRKFVQEKPVYQSRKFERPKRFGRTVLSDFGSAVRGDEIQKHDAQPNVYRCPEVMLKTEWSYPADVWNVGAMIWDIFEDKHLFYGNDPDGSGYKTRAHLAEVVAVLGPPPLDLLKRGARSGEFFDTDGHWKAGVPIPKNLTLENSSNSLDGERKAAFLRFVRGLLQWRPEDRKTAEQLLDDPWLDYKH